MLNSEENGGAFMYGNYGHSSVGLLGFSVFTFVIWIITYMIVMGIVGYVFSKACERKGYEYGEGHVFAAVFWLGIFGCLYAICLPEKKNKDGLNQNTKKDVDVVKADKVLEEESNKPIKTGFELVHYNGKVLAKVAGSTVDNYFCPKCYQQINPNANSCRGCNTEF